MDASIRHCIQCGKQIKGRTDKKFCDDYCRNVFNNRRNSDQNNYIRNINNTLRRNRRILESLLPPEGIVKTSRSKLLEAGFNFQFHTHQYTNKKGDVYYFCYEYGFLPLENNWYLLVKRGEGNI